MTSSVMGRLNPSTFSRLFSIVLMIVIHLPAANSSCPSQCTCRYQTNNQKAVICSTTDLSSPPHNLDPQTQLLTVMGSRDSPFSLSHLTRNDFKSLARLEHLTVSFTHLTSIEEDTFLDLVHLKRIDLANNKLADILPNTFITLRNLTFISLSNNPGLVVNDRAFWNLQSLKELYLSGIGLTELRPAMFYGLTSLRQLDVSSNQLTSFSPDVMLNMPNLWSLDLAFNDLMSLDSLLEPFFVHLKRVQLGGNRWQCNCLLRWLKTYPQFIAPRSSDSVICSAPAGLEYVALAEVDVQQLVCAPPVIHNCPPSVTVMEGDDLTIRCLVTGDPYPSITWTFADGTRMESGSYPGMPIKDRAAIRIHRVPMSHHGTLTLTASNGVGTQTTQITVIVWRRTTPTTTTTTTTTPTPSTLTSTTPPSTTATATTATSPPTTVASSVTTSTTHKPTTKPSLPSKSTSTTTTTTITATTTPSTTRKTSTSSPATKSTTVAKQNRLHSTKAPKTDDDKKAGQTPEAQSKVDITPIVIASVASTATIMLAGGIFIYVFKKWTKKPRHPFKSKVVPATPESSIEEATAADKDLTDHVLRMQKFDAPTRPSTLY